MTTIIYNGNTPITLTATEKQFSTTAEKTRFTTFMNHVIDESGFGDKFTVTNTVPRSTTTRAARTTTRAARTTTRAARTTTRAAPSTHTCDDDCGHSIASRTRSRSSRTNTTRSAARAARSATTPLIFQGNDTNVLSEYTIETYGRGYLLFPPADCCRFGQKYFHNAWWMPSQDAWFFRGEHFDYIVGLGASWHSSS
jgi:hypothetical protein